MATRGRLVFDGDNLYTKKEARIYTLTSEIESAIDSIPAVVDDLSSSSDTDALSANMGRVLQEQINSLSGIGVFLSGWNATTGLPDTNPQDDPYVYEAGNYYLVSAVGATNYKPHGGTYTQGVPSTAVETRPVAVNDKYYYDGADWLLLPNTTTPIVVDSSLSNSSTNPVQNKVITSALNGKQNTISDLNTIRSGASAGATAVQPGANISTLTNNLGYQTAGDVSSLLDGSIHVGATAPGTPTEGVLWYDTTNDILKVYDGTNWNEVGSGVGGDVSGPSSSTDNNIAVFDGTTGKIIKDSGSLLSDYLAKNNTSSFTPSGDYNPATKKYVDDSLSSTMSSGAAAPANPVEGQLWYDTTNDVLKVYDGTNWVVVGTDMSNYLAKDNTTVFTPTGDYNPATKKYVDDSVSSAMSSGTTAPSNPVEGQLWYDTTNDVLKVYDGTNWVEVGGATYTAGNGISINGTTISNTGVLSSNSTYNNVIHLSQSDYDNLQNKDPNTLYSTPDAGGSSIVDDTAYGSTWDGVTAIAPSKNAVYDKINSMDTTMGGLVSDTAYAASWDGDTTHAPSKNAVYDVLGNINTLLANI